MNSDILLFALFGGWGLLLLISVAIYFIPAFIAWKRKHPQLMPILALNIFLGWTLLGWVGALIWSLYSFDTATSVNAASDKSAKLS